MKSEEYGKILLRISLSLVFLWFGFNQIYAPGEWIGYVPSFLTSFFSANTIILSNGIFEVVLGLMLLTGMYVRFSAALLGLHLINISFSLGFSAVAVRDFGLSLATIALFLQGPDAWSLDAYFTRKKSQHNL